MGGGLLVPLHRQIMVDDGTFYAESVILGIAVLGFGITLLGGCLLAA